MNKNKSTMMMGFYICLLILFTSEQYVYSYPEYLSPNEKPYMVKDKYCGAYSVWHTLQYCGHPKPIDTLVREMQIDQKDGSSIADVVETLKTNGISAHAVKINLNRIDKVDRPFIPYTVARKNDRIGHLHLCIPNASKEIVLLDGKRSPSAIQLDMLLDNTPKGWDGTSILIDGTFTRKLYRLNSNPISLLCVAFVLLLFLQYLLIRKLNRSRHRKQEESTVIA